MLARFDEVFEDIQVVMLNVVKMCYKHWQIRSFLLLLQLTRNAQAILHFTRT